MRRVQSFVAVLTLTMAGALAGPAWAQTLSGADLVAALKEGGLVVVMRHAASPREAPDATAANPDNPGRERQLDAAGRETAAAMGAAIAKLGVPVGAVYSSPAYRALETVRLAGLGEPQTVEELGLPGSMATDPAAMEARGAWLRARAAEAPPAGTNVFVVTHAPNVSAGFGDAAAGFADGEALMLRPDGAGGAAVVGRVRIEEWPALAEAL